MAWLTSFLLGRPGSEYTFELRPEGMRITDAGIVVRQRNLAGDLKKSTLKVSTPTIQINSNYLGFTQASQFRSLVGVSDTFLSFQTRDDWTQYDERASIITTSKFRLNNSSALLLSKTLVDLSLSSSVAISTVTSDEAGWSSGAVTWSGSSFNINVANAVATTSASIFVTYIYTGWLVEMKSISTVYRGGWADQSNYDFELTGV